MKSYFFFFLFIGFSCLSMGQTSLSFKDEIKGYQADQNKKFKDDRTSPLKASDRSKFKKLKFYQPKRDYRVTAKFVRTSGSEPFEMPTTTDRKAIYEKYGELHFTIKGQTLKLDVYQSHHGRRNPLYRNDLFLPFKDQTNGKKSYGGGRFIDLKIPKGDTVVVDFNKAFNPYCAYNSKYSCPIVPMGNHLNTAIKAGVKGYKKQEN